MRRTSLLCLSAVIVVVALGLLLAPASSAWSQERQPPPASPNPSTAQVLATGAAGMGTVVYAPFKAIVLCPGMAVASGASLAFTHGDRSTAGYLLRLGCTGTYVVTPEMVRGQAQFNGAGER